MTKSMVLACGMLMVALAATGDASAGSERRFRISSASMQPTLLEGDLIAVSGHDPCGRTVVSVGDVVSYRVPPSEIHPTGGEIWIGRIVAGGGQTVAVRGGVLIVDGRPVERVLVGPFEHSSLPEFRPRPAIYVESFPGGRSVQTLDFGPESYMDDIPERTISSGQWFILGDNRDNSIDSRYFGPVPAADVCGVATEIVSAEDRARIGTRP